MKAAGERPGASGNLVSTKDSTKVGDNVNHCGIMLLIAAGLEIVWAIGLKYTNGFTRSGLRSGSFWRWPPACSARPAADGLPIGTAYGVWTGIGAAPTAIIGMLLLNESRDWVRMVCIGLIILGVFGLNAFTRVGAAPSVAEAAARVTNLGRTPELLAHPSYGPTFSSVLAEASRTCSEVMGRPVDLLARVRSAKETTDLISYPEDVALIVAVEMAQIRSLEEFFGIAVGEAKLAFGYSLGEAAALIAAGVYEMRHLLRVPLTLAHDAVTLAHDIRLGVLFSRGPALDPTAVKRLCLEINHKGKGTIGVSTYLSPNPAAPGSGRHSR